MSTTQKLVQVAEEDLALDLAWVGDREVLTKMQCDARDRMREDLKRYVDLQKAFSGRVESSEMLAAIPMLLWCPECGHRHVDNREFEMKLHHTHACQNCGHVWRPAVVNTVGVRFLPGFKNKSDESDESD